MQTLTSKRIVWQAPDGSIKVTSPVEDPLDGETEQHYLDRIALAATSTDPGLQGHTRMPDVEAADLPSRRFRNCWRHNGITVVPDVKLAASQCLVELRAERDVMLAASDADMMKAQEQGTAQQVADLKTYRQALRDITATVAVDLDKAATADAMDQYKPAWPVKPT